MGASPLDLRLELPERVPAAAEVKGSLTVTNSGSETVSVVAPFSAAALSLVVFDRYWNLVEPGSEAKAHVAEERAKLGPGDSLAWDLPDLSFVSGTAQMRYALEPGAYHVLAVYHPGTHRLPEESSYPLVVVSEVVPLEVEAG